MRAPEYRYRFLDRVCMAAVEDTLVVAVCAAEGVHGQVPVRLEAVFRLDKGARTGVVDGSTPVGRTIAGILTGLLTREFGEDAFSVKRITAQPNVDAPQEASSTSP